MSTVGLDFNLPLLNNSHLKRVNLLYLHLNNVGFLFKIQLVPDFLAGLFWSLFLFLPLFKSTSFFLPIAFFLRLA